VDPGPNNPALATAHLVDANGMDGRARAMTQTVLDGPLHDRGHALPVQSVLARRALPAQLPRQHRHGLRKRRGHPGPRFRPGKVLHPHPAARASYPPRTVAQLQRQLPHGQVTPFPLLSPAVSLPAAPTAYPAAQQPPAQTVYAHEHELFGFLYLGYRVRFQAQLFSDKGFYQHLGAFSFVLFWLTTLKDRTQPRCCSQVRQSASPCPPRASDAITLFG